MNEYKLAMKYLSKSKSSLDRGIDFELTIAQFKKLRSAKRCFYTGIELTKSGDNVVSGTDLSLDRIDSSLGYTKENVVPCCHLFNQIKAIFEQQNCPLSTSHVIQGLAVLKEMEDEL